MSRLPESKAARQRQSDDRLVLRQVTTFPGNTGHRIARALRWEYLIGNRVMVNNYRIRASLSRLEKTGTIRRETETHRSIRTGRDITRTVWYPPGQESPT